MTRDTCKWGHAYSHRDKRGKAVCPTCRVGWNATYWDRHKRARPMTCDELIAEWEWCIEGGRTARETAEAMGKSLGALEITFRRAGRPDLAKQVRDAMGLVAA